MIFTYLDEVVIANSSGIARDKLSPDSSSPW